MVATNLRYKKSGGGKIPATAIKLSATANIGIRRNKHLDVTATLTPSDSTDTVTWSPSSSNVTINPKEGLSVVFTAVGSAGSTCRIMATTTSGKTAITTVTIDP